MNKIKQLCLYCIDSQSPDGFKCDIHCPSCWILLRYFKDMCYVWGKKQQNLQLLDILACIFTQLLHHPSVTTGGCYPPSSSTYFTIIYYNNMCYPSVQWPLGMVNLWECNRVFNQNIQTLLIFGVFASYIACILKIQQLVNPAKYPGHLMRELSNIRWASSGASVASLYIAVDSCFIC